MVEPTPQWSVTANYSLTDWYGHVHLLPNKVLGQWICVERLDGTVLWDKQLFRPNTICGVDQDTIVASEKRSDGPWTLDFGCYGISLETGELLWTSHGHGWWGRFLRACDFVPGFTNEFRDTPHHLANGECFCISGRVLDVQTGTDLRRVSPEEVQQYEKPQSDAQRLYHDWHSDQPGRVRAGKRNWLSHKISAELIHVRGSLPLYLMRDDGTVEWHFDIKDTGFHIDGNYYSYRYCYPFVYIVVSEEKNWKDDPTKPHYALPNPTFFHLVTLDLDRREIVQDIRLNEHRVADCRIEDVDEAGMLISDSYLRLQYFARDSR